MEKCSQNLSEVFLRVSSPMFWQPFLFASHYRFNLLIIFKWGNLILKIDLIFLIGNSIFKIGMFSKIVIIFSNYLLVQGARMTVLNDRNLMIHIILRSHLQF
jgi:hypothetical protein